MTISSINSFSASSISTSQMSQVQTSATSSSVASTTTAVAQEVFEKLDQLTISTPVAEKGEELEGIQFNIKRLTADEIKKTESDPLFVEAEKYEDGIEAHFQKALELYKQAAKQGNAPAQNRLGIYYTEQKGQDEEGSFEHGIDCFASAAKQGYPSALFNLGVCYGYKSLAWDKAIQYYKLAADRGHDDAQVELGDFYHEGMNGLPKDFEEAARFFKKAADQGNCDAIYRLGEAYKEGEGVPKDLVEANRLFNLAAAKGYGEEDYIASL